MVYIRQQFADDICPAANAFFKKSALSECFWFKTKRARSWQVAYSGRPSTQ